MENKQNNDFKFVQMDEKIHDIKFETKPTTFFKDAFRRFRKNKSSVVAGFLIGTLITFAIVVPLVNKSNITSSFPQGTFLTPRWPGFENVSALNGTKDYKDIVMDMRDPNNPSPVGFFNDSIVGEVKYSQAYYNTASDYGSGGSVVLRTDKRDRDAALVSPYGLFDSTNEYQFTLNLNNRGSEVDTLPNYAIYLDVKYGTDTTIHPVLMRDFSTTIGQVIVNDISEKVKAEQPVEILETSFEGRFRFVLKTAADTVNDGAYPVIYLDSFVVENIDDESDNNFATSGVNFTDANELLLRDKINLNPLSWRIFAGSPTTAFYSGSKTISNVIITLGSFRYDLYKAAFGDRAMVIGEQELKRFIDLKYIEYDFNVGVESFKLLDEENSPVRSISSQRVTVLPDFTVKEVNAVVSIYRYYGYESIPYFVFGTNQRGHDFFKVVFSGLNTSLLLGLVVALINIFIGIVWGAISGYYGGTIDLVMERFTEILSGVPGIVVMTLAILTLGNSFGVFIMAMILTGWIGIAARTRSQFYRYKRREYVLASRTLGANDGRIIFRHILPNSVGPLITSGVLMIPGIIFTEASISYLNLGLQGLPSFGVAMSEVQQYIHTSPYLILSAAIIVSLLMISFNLFGNGLRDAFNPSLKGVE